MEEAAGLIQLFSSEIRIFDPINLELPAWQRRPDPGDEQPISCDPTFDFSCAAHDGR